MQKKEINIEIKGKTVYDISSKKGWR